MYKTKELKRIETDLESMNNLTILVKYNVSINKQRFYNQIDRLYRNYITHFDNNFELDFDKLSNDEFLKMLEIISIQLKNDKIEEKKISRAIFFEYLFFSITTVLVALFYLIKFL